MGSHSSRGAVRRKMCAEIFWTKVQIGAPDECWPWRQSTKAGGYGQLMVARRNVLAHRYAYELTNGAIPAGQFVCHSCDNRRCCNPAHLWLGTPLDNVRDMYTKGRRRSPSPEVVRVAMAKRGRTNAKLTIDDVRTIRQRRANGESLQSIANAYGVNQSNISKITRNQSWNDIPA